MRSTGGKRIGLAWKMGKGKEDNRARGCCGQRATLQVLTDPSPNRGHPRRSWEKREDDGKLLTVLVMSLQLPERNQEEVSDHMWLESADNPSLRNEQKLDETRRCHSGKTVAMAYLPDNEHVWCWKVTVCCLYRIYRWRSHSGNGQEVMEGLESLNPYLRVYQSVEDIANKCCGQTQLTQATVRLQSVQDLRSIAFQTCLTRHAWCLETQNPRGGEEKDSSSDILVITVSYYELGVSWLLDLRQEKPRKKSPMLRKQTTLWQWGDEAVGNDYPASWLDAVSEPLRYPGEMNREAVWKEAFPEGSRSSLPGSGEAAEAMPAAGMPGLSRPRAYQHSRVNESHTMNSDEAVGNDYPASWLDAVSEPLRYPGEMNREAVWKEAFPEGSRSSLPGSGEAAEAMPAAGMPGLSRPGAYQHSSVNESHTTNSDEAVGNDYPASWLDAVSEPLRYPGEMNHEAVWKEAFPEGSRSSLPGSGEAAEAMPAAGMPGLSRPGAYQHSSVNESHTTNSDEAVGNDYPASWLDAVSEPLRYPGEMNREAVWKEAFPEGSRSSLPGSGEAAEAMPAAGMPGLSRPGAYQHSSVNESHTTNSDEAVGNDYPASWLDAVSEPLRYPGEMNREAVWKEAFPEGSRSSLPGSGEAAEAMPAAGMPGLSRPGAYQHSSVNESHTTNSDVVNKATTGAPSPQGNTSFFCHEVMGKHCVIFTVATMISIPLAIVFFCVAIWQWRTAKKLRSAEAAARRSGIWQPPLTPEKKTGRCGTSERYTQNQQLLALLRELAHPPSLQLLSPPSTSPAAKPQWEHNYIIRQLMGFKSARPQSSPALRPSGPSPALQGQDQDGALQHQTGVKEARPASSPLQRSWNPFSADLKLMKPWKKPNVIQLP
ncbi:hypothetical protein Q9966_007094 [Columba livia]|nr:hypothetical protein Q9966_007094 [Columba livia]